MFTLAMKMLKKEYKSAIFYLLTMVLSIAVSCIFISIVSDQILRNGGNTVPVSECLALFIVILCMFMIFYVNNNYILNKKEEMGILITSGYSYFQIVLYLLYQTGFLFVIASIPGVISGYVSTQYVYQLIASRSNIAVPSITLYTLIYIVVIVALIFFFIVVSTIIYVNTHDVKTILYEHDNMNQKGVVGRFKLPFIIFLVLYLAGIYLIYSPYVTLVNINGPYVLCIVGIFGLVTGGFTSMIKLWKKYFIEGSKYFGISLSNLSATILRSSMLLMIYIFSVFIMYYLTLYYSSSFAEYIVSFTGYIMVVILVSLIILSDIMIEMKSRATFFVNLWKIGYVRKDLYKMVRQEVIMYYLLILVLPLSMMLPIGLKYINLSLFSVSVFYFLIFFYIAVALVSAVIACRIYHNIVKRAVVTK